MITFIISQLLEHPRHSIPLVSYTISSISKENSDSLPFLDNIARKYNTDYNLLALLNGLNVNDYIYPNNTILVPKKDVKYYFTKKDDTIASVNKLLNANINKLLRENNNIYLSEGQLIVYKD